MRDRKTALMWAVAWWFGRRWLRRRAALAVAGVASGAAARRGKLRAVAGALLLVGALATGFVVWRRLAGGGEPEWVTPEPVAAPPPTIPDAAST
ncbi:MAG TPA: hypothetical protein VHR46_09520 [Gaiella sp.]|jgi:hypothetical protein|nr:hypothetical protein [Gaiella sp.]